MVKDQRRNIRGKLNQTRLTWVMASLVASMTIGTLFLGVLEPRQALSSEVSYLAATYNRHPAPGVISTELPIEPTMWNWVVVHRSLDDLDLQCLADKRGRRQQAHFGIRADGTTIIGRSWKLQRATPGQNGIIHIVVQVSDLKAGATLNQADRLVGLIRELQARCLIRPQEVHLHSQLSPGNCPGRLLSRYNWRDLLLGVSTG